VDLGSSVVAVTGSSMIDVVVGFSSVVEGGVVVGGEDEYKNADVAKITNADIPAMPNAMVSLFNGKVDIYYIFALIHSNITNIDNTT
jgi:hypothetical protein